MRQVLNDVFLRKSDLVQFLYEHFHSARIQGFGKEVREHFLSALVVQLCLSSQNGILWPHKYCIYVFDLSQSMSATNWKSRCCIHATDDGNMHSPVTKLRLFSECLAKSGH